MRDVIQFIDAALLLDGNVAYQNNRFAETTYSEFTVGFN
jgi:hypothetical protein